MTAAGTVVICLGNDLRGDDGAGLEVARRLRPLLPPRVELVESDGDPADIIDAWSDRPLAVVVDAVVSGAPPGTIHRHAGPPDPPADPQADPPADPQEGPQTGLDVPAAPRRSSHSLGLAEATALGRALGRLPAALAFYGIEATDLTLGAPVTPAAKAAAEKVADAIARSWRRT